MTATPAAYEAARQRAHQLLARARRLTAEWKLAAADIATETTVTDRHAIVLEKYGDAIEAHIQAFEAMSELRDLAIAWDALREFAHSVRRPALRG